MRIDEFITALRKQHNISLSENNNELKIITAKEDLTQEVIDSIKLRKQEILDFFNETNEEGIGKTIPLASAKDYYQLSSAQRRLYFLQEFSRDSVAYNLSHVVMLEGDLDTDKLTQVFNTLIERHESLRTSFVDIDGEIFQKIREDVNIEIEHFDIGNDAEVKPIAEKFIRPFDLTKDALIRLGLIKMSHTRHVLILDMHHIISDGISQGILISEFVALYHNNELPELVLQYKDFAEWQQDIKSNGSVLKSKEFWLQSFSEISSLELPTDFKRPLVKEHDGNVVQFHINENDTNRLNVIAKEEGATLFMVVLAIYNIFLSKLSGQEDITIGTPVAGREHADLQNVIGMFVNTLPLRNYPEASTKFSSFLSEVKVNVLSCFENQSYQYDQLVNELNLERDTSRNPLFDVLFAFQNFDEPDVVIDNLVVKPYNRRTVQSKFDIGLTASENEGQLKFKLEYATSLFKDETIQRYTQWFQTIISSIVNNKDIQIADIGIISLEEQEQLLSKLNNTKVELEDETVLTLFEKQVALTPDNVAIKHENGFLTYNGLEKLSNQIAQYLVNTFAIDRGDFVGLLLNRDEFLVPILLGVMKTGGAYLPMDPKHPELRIQAIVEEANPKLIISQIEHEELIGQVETNVIYFEDVQEVIKSSAKESIAREITPTDLAYTIYTSGSTGKPKGVMIQHSSVHNLICYMQSKYPLHAEDTYLLKTNYCFDVSVAEIFGWFSEGGSIAILPKGMEIEPDKLLSFIEEKEVTHLNFVPSAFSVFLENLSTEDTKKIDALKFIFVAGEELTTTLAKNFLELNSSASLVNMYGPTEGTVYSCGHAVEEVNGKIPIGKPLDNVQLYIISNEGRIQPIGVKGELCIAGSNLAKGYLNDKVRTNEKFIPNPFTDGEVMYKTGDVARWLPDGSIEFLGRKDDQVKLRGFRIELGEIESHLLSYDKIKEAVVLVRQKGSDKFLVAYYVGTEELESESLREYLMERLPDYMVPSYYVPMESFPLTANDKLNKAALPLPEVSQKNYVAPQTPKEELLAEVWSKVLGLDQVGITDNFFSVGGDSIKSIQISSRVRSSGYELSVQDIFAHQTIKSLSPHLQTLSKESQQSDVEGTSSLTPIQSWFFEGPIANKNHFNQSVMINFSEGISRTEVETIFNKLHDHHDALRMVYPSEGGVISQVNRGTDIVLSITEEDLTKELDIESSLLSSSQSLQTGITINEGPLVHLGLFHTPSGSRLLIVIHHLVVDGVSWRILFEDIESLYQQLKQAEPMVLPKKTDPFLSWSSRLKEYRLSNDFVTGREYWNDFHGKSIERIPRDNPNGSNRGTDREMLSFTLSPDSTHRLLHDVHSSFGTQVNDILLSALYLSIEKEYDFNHLQIDLESHGRASLPYINISRTVGWFTTLYPVLLSRQGEGLGDLIKGVKEGLRKVPNSGLDYLLIKHSTEDLIWKDQESNSQLLFNYLGQFDTDTSGRSYGISDDARGEEVSQSEERSYDWDVSGAITSGKLMMSLSYSNAQYNSDRMNSLVRHFEESLVEIIDYCTSYGKTELTPSDMTYPGLSIPQLDLLQQKYDLVDIYPLSPMQEGLLFHSMLDISAGDYFGQTTCQIKGQLDITIVEEGMNALMSRYDILRTLFLHEGYDRSLQVVLKERKIDFLFKDIRLSQIEEEINFYKDQEKSRTFDLSQDVLMRLVVLQTSEDEYEFIWSHHHVLMDGWCIGIIVNEFVEIYNKKLNGQQLSLRSVKPYSEYIKWLENLENDSSREYWKGYLADYNDLSGFPRKDKLSDEQSIYHLDTQELALDEKQTTIINEFSRSHGLTVNTLFQTVWGILLGKYNNSSDVVFGSVVSGRPSEIEGIETMVGLFINTIPVRINFTGEERIADLLKTVQQQSVEGNRHHYYPLSEIQSLSSLGNGLLDHIIAFENYPLSEQVGGDGNAETNEQSFTIRNAEYKVQTNYDLSITVVPSKEFGVRFDYNSSQIDSSVIATLKSQLQHLIFSVIELFDKPISALSLFTEEEELSQKLRLSTDLETVTDLPLLQEQLEKTFDKYGANTAIEYRGQSYTYFQLDKDIGKIAYSVANSNLEEGSEVGVFCSDRYWLICSIIGILKARMVFVPLETTLPKSRLNSMIDQTGTNLIVTDQDKYECEDLRESSVNWLNIGDIRHSNNHLDWNNSYQQDDKMYVYFTSGSTGAPKGVVGKNKGLSHFIQWEINTFNIDQQFRISQFTNPGFDVFMRDIFVPLCAGGTLCIPEENILSMHQGLGQWITEQRITLIHCVPSLFKLIQKDSLNSDLFNNLKYVLLAGEKILPFELKEWYNQFGDSIQLVNIYGPTETTLAKAYYLIKPEDTRRSYIPLKPIDGAQLLILDNNLNPVPKGAVGEIYIRTPYRTAGYLNLGQANQNSFITNPYSDDENDVLYKTGDLGKIHDNDEIEVLGRLDHQVKIRGIRIELDDIKENILNFSGVTDAVVTVRLDSEEEKYICAYVVSEESDMSPLKEYLENILPQNMIPSYFIHLTNLPLLPNGKVDRKSLPEPAVSKASDHEGAANEVEEKLLTIFSEILRVEKDVISTTASFFELGGHSVKVFHLINKIQQDFSIKLKLGDVFENPSISSISSLLIDQEKEDIVQIPKAEAKEFHPASPAQERMYYQHLLHDESTGFNITNIVQINGEVYPDKIADTFQLLVERHASLRTSFILSDNGVIQKVNENVKFETSLIEVEDDKSLLDILNDFIRPFDLSMKSLMRCGLVKHESGNFLIVDIHHMVADGSSFEVLISDFKKIYLKREIPPLTLQYTDYANWLHNAQEYIGAQKDYWADKLSGTIERTELPTYQDRESVDIKEVSYKELVIDKESYTKVKDFVTESKVSDFMFFLSVYYLLLQKMSGNDDVIIGTEVLGRTHPGLKDIVGTFVNVVPLRVKIDSEITYRDFLKDTKKCVIDAFYNQDFQFDQMVSLADENKLEGRNPIFDFYFSVANSVDGDTELSELEFVPVGIKRQIKGEYEFTIKVSESKNAIKLTFVYSNQLYDEETVELLTSYYLNIMDDALNNPKKKLEEIEMVKLMDEMV